MKKDPKEYQKKVHIVAKPIFNLKSKEYEDPRDAMYLNTFKLSKGFDKLVKLYFEYGIERMNTICYTGSNIRVTEKNMPYVYQALVTVCETLGVEKIPPLYVMQGGINAFTVGAQDPIIVINDDCIRRLTHEELLFILGHEVGHIKSEHCLYHSLGASIPIIGGIVGSLTLGFGELIMQGLMIAYYDWVRKSEYTADRAGLLACQDINAAVSTMAKIAGLPKTYYDYFDEDSFLEQAQVFEDMDSSLYNRVLKILSAKGATHPWTVLRAKELNVWIHSGEYDRILNRTSKWLVEEEERLTNQAEAERQKMEENQNKAQQARQEADRMRMEAEAAQAQLQYESPDRRAVMARQVNAMMSNANAALNKANATEKDAQKAWEKMDGTLKELKEISSTINKEALRDLEAAMAQAAEAEAVVAQAAGEQAAAVQVAEAQAAAAQVAEAE